MKVVVLTTDTTHHAYFVRAVVEELGVEPPVDAELDQKMSWSQVRELGRHPLFAVGGHGHTHRILEFLDDAELEREVATSVAKLETAVRGPIEHYSYPEGMANCYSDRVIAVLRRHGIVSAPTAEPGTNRVGDDLFRLKRVMVS